MHSFVTRGETRDRVRQGCEVAGSLARLRLGPIRMWLRLAGAASSCPHFVRASHPDRRKLAEFISNPASQAC
jgi:hypothetical protein